MVSENTLFSLKTNLLQRYVIFNASLLLLLTAQAGLAQRQKRPAQPPVPPVTRPTSQTQPPLTPQQVTKHKNTIRRLRRESPEAFSLMPERMPPARETHAKAEEIVRRGVPFNRIIRGNPTLREIALTFDDGPHPMFTPRLLDLLRDLNIRATFFVVGEMVDQAPYLLVQMALDGHEIGNHTYHHMNLTKLSPDLVENEIRLANDSIRNACGIPPVYFRPPGGQYNEETIRVAAKLNMTTVLWTDDPADYVSPGQAVIEQRLLGHIRNGAVILLHDGIEQTAAILPDLIARLRRQGYRFVTLSEMAQHQENETLVRR